MPRVLLPRPLIACSQDTFQMVTKPMRTLALGADGRLPEAVTVAIQKLGAAKRQAALANGHYSILQQVGFMTGNTYPKPVTFTFEDSRVHHADTGLCWYQQTQ